MAKRQLRWRTGRTLDCLLAASAYLTLLYDRDRAAELVGRLQSDADFGWWRANDLLRAAGLAPLPPSDPGVRKALKPRRRHAPVLVLSRPVGAIIADGYHRISAAYSIDPFSKVPCFVASIDF